MPVSCVDSSHSDLAVPASRASGLRGDGPVGPRIAKRGPMNVLPGRSAEAAYSVWRAPNSALVANRLLPVSQNRVPSGLPVWPCRLVAE